MHTSKRGRGRGYPMVDNTHRLRQSKQLQPLSRLWQYAVLLCIKLAAPSPNLAITHRSSTISRFSHVFLHLTRSHRRYLRPGCCRGRPRQTRLVDEWPEPTGQLLQHDPACFKFTSQHRSTLNVCLARQRQVRCIRHPGRPRYLLRLRHAMGVVPLLQCEHEVCEDSVYCRQAVKLTLLC